MDITSSADETKKVTVAYQEGFGDRLTFVLNNLGVRQHGRVNILAEWSKLSPSGVRLWFTENRPPRHREIFDNLLSGILAEASLRKWANPVNPRDLECYLLQGGESPIQKPTDRNNSGAAGNAADSLLGSQLLVQLVNLAKANDINFFTDLDSDTRNRLVRRLLESLQPKKLSLESEAFKEVATAFLKIARNGALP